MSSTASAGFDSDLGIHPGPGSSPSTHPSVSPGLPPSLNLEAHLGNSGIHPRAQSVDPMRPGIPHGAHRPDETPMRATSAPSRDDSWDAHTPTDDHEDTFVPFEARRPRARRGRGPNHPDDPSLGSRSPPPLGPVEFPGLFQSQNLALKVAKLETTVEHIKVETTGLKTELRDFRQEFHTAITSIRTQDFRILFGALIAVALGLAAVMAKGFHWI